MSIHPEELLISAVLNGTDVLVVEDKGINPSHFFEHRAAWEWLLDYRVRYSENPTTSTFRSAFPDFSINSHTGVDYAVEQVLEHHLHRSLARATRQTMQLLREGEPATALDTMAREVMALSSGMGSAKSLTPGRDTGDFMDYLIARGENPDTGAVPFSHDPLQDLTGGMTPGELIIWAARLGQGKSWVLVDNCIPTLLQGKRVLFASLEMSELQMRYRFVTALANRYKLRLSHDALATGKGLDLIAVKEIVAEINERCRGEYYILDNSRGRVTTVDLAAAILKYSPDLVVVDYITLLATASGQRCAEGWQVATAVSNELKEMATRYNVPIMAAAQINRDGDRGSWKPPKVVNLSQSDSIGQDADKVITMRRQGLRGMAYLLDKNRHGRSGLLYFSGYDPDSASFPIISADTAADYRFEGTLDDES